MGHCQNQVDKRLGQISELHEDRRDSGTESEGDDPRASKHSPRQVGAEPCGAAHFVARRMDRFAECVATCFVRSREDENALFPDTREP